MIYTSRYSNPELKTGKYTVVGITRGAPKFRLDYELAGNIIEIAPPGYLFNEYNRERFTPQYFRHMDRTGARRIAEILAGYQRLDQSKDVVLCCYEDVRTPNEWCHRLVFAEWWYSRTGELVGELPDPSVPKVKAIPAKEAKTVKPEPPKEPAQPQAEQLSLW